MSMILIFTREWNRWYRVLRYGKGLGLFESVRYGPWVSELRTTWKRVHSSQDKRACIIDLNDVTFIDKSGERLLRAMSMKCAQLLAKGLYVQHVLEQMKTRG